MCGTAQPVFHQAPCRCVAVKSWLNASQVPMTEAELKSRHKSLVGVGHLDELTLISAQFGKDVFVKYGGTFAIQWARCWYTGVRPTNTNGGW